MSLTHAILGVLEAKPMNGYELAQFFSTQASWVWSAPSSQIYPQLRKMQEAGLITSESQIRGTKLETRVYSITKSGLEELRRWVATPLDTTMKRDVVFLQAVLFDLIEPEEAVKVLQHVIDEHQRLLTEWQKHAEQLREKGSPLLEARLAHRPAREHDRITEIKARVFEGSAALAQARIDWAKEELRFLAQQSSGKAADNRRSKPRKKVARG